MTVYYPYTKEAVPERLTDEILASSILTAYDHIEYTFPALKVFFKAELSTADKDTLDTVVAAHLPIPYDPEADVLKTTDKRLIVKPSVRPLLTYGTYVGAGDDPFTPGDTGGGPGDTFIDHKVGDPTTIVVPHRFNVEGNRTFLWEGYLTFENAIFDEFSFIIKPVPTPITSATGTNYLAYNGVIVPVNGTGNALPDMDNLCPVSSVPKTDTGVFPAAYWNATYSPSTGKYTNLTPAPDGKGKYNLFYTDYVIKRHINRFRMLGSNHMVFAATDPSELGTNLKCEYQFTTVGPDHPWRASISMSMFREKIK